MNARRLYAPVVLLTLAAGGAAFLAAGRPWAHVRVATAGLPTDRVDVTGSSAQPIVPALALVVVAAALAVLAASPRVRRGVGAFTTLVSVIAIVLVATGGSSLDDAVRRAVEKSPAFTGHGVPDPSRTWWNVVALVAFAVAALLGLVTARHGAVWPTMSSRYDAPAARPRADTPQSDADIWKAFDEGRDPTQ